MGRREIFPTSSLLVEIEGHFTHEFVAYVYETQDRFRYSVAGFLDTVLLQHVPSIHHTSSAVQPYNKALL
jgi:hypothetical protein